MLNDSIKVGRQIRYGRNGKTENSSFQFTYFSYKYFSDSTDVKRYVFLKKDIGIKRLTYVTVINEFITASLINLLSKDWVMTISLPLQ